MPLTIPGWLPIKEAAGKYSLDYELLRNLVIGGVLTRGNFEAGRRRSIFLRSAELDAYKKCGPAAAIKLKQEFEEASRTKEA